MSMSELNQLEMPAYNVSEWEEYARLHASVTTSIQLDLYRDACLYLHGAVADCGCGSAKIAPLLADRESVSAYIGIDFAQEMVSVARQIIQTLNRPSFSILHGRIEEAEGQFDSAVSIQSYYSWPEPLLILKHIFGMLVDGGNFVLATPNKALSPEKLLHDAEKELIAHPDFEAFKRYNLKLAHNPQANFVSMDELIRQVQSVGFQVVECHQRHFGGGINFLVLHKEMQASG